VLVLEIRLGKIARQVRFQNMVELAIHGTLEKREERLGRSYDAHLLTTNSTLQIVRAAL
jgi:hypothetical protein